MAWVGVECGELGAQASGYLTADVAAVQYFHDAKGCKSAYSNISPGWRLGLGETEADCRKIAQVK